ncbi:DUF6463 family protein [Stackebrandtia nassauensis]|uniref:Uncharacterized protein n=1 Tax=Stackebrandtia nassauensis (strain DSM 44728 / CIP 108903 / NRRL B-16338 / NBRC 102104 / LLR-40K-21) TaxID=446470 RepID=D3Q4R8_STANL|nr:DUF6463 family protein [Stackebrandtia nassauensis]ADD42098.1 hypothetical protein Snas_2415 [Stackebrandtia nassauensis DSM 44728]
MRTVDRWIISLCCVLMTLHFLAAVTLTPWIDVVTTGWFDTRLDHPPRDATVWFFIGGVALLVVISLARMGIRTTGRLPVQVGVYLLVIGVPLTLFQPVSGGIGVVATGVLALLASRSAATASAAPPGTDAVRRPSSRTS